MTTVFTHMTMSLDGFIADPQDGIEEIFPWYDAGDVRLTTHNEDISFTVDANGAALLEEMMSRTGALIAGRRLFDITNGWGDNHPIGAPTVIVTHRAPDDTSPWPRTTFVNDVATAVATAKEIAGDEDVVISSASISAQALDLGLVDEVHISLAPVLLGSGIPYFASLTNAPHRFDDPVVVQGSRALHLRYAVRR
jgi:dihydrofolate reductase